MDDGRFRRVSDGFYVAPQLTPEDFAAAKALGVRTVINNRPDGEAPDQLSDARARELAAAAGLAYAHVPVPQGGIGPEALNGLVEAMEALPGPYLAYCRSGTRSCHLWALQEARRRPPGEIVQAAAGAGYDLGPARELLRRIHEAHRSDGAQAR